MARGWESKSVEEQQAIAASDREAGAPPDLTPDERALAAEHRVLSLARARVLQELQTACNALRRAQLEAALADVDEQLRRLGHAGGRP